MKKLIVLKEMHIFQIITYIIILKTIFIVLVRLGE